MPQWHLHLTWGRHWLYSSPNTSSSQTVVISHITITIATTTVIIIIIIANYWCAVRGLTQRNTKSSFSKQTYRVLFNFSIVWLLIKKTFGDPIHSRNNCVRSSRRRHNDHCRLNPCSSRRRHMDNWTSKPVLLSIVHDLIQLNPQSISLEMRSYIQSDRSLLEDFTEIEGVQGILLLMQGTGSQEIFEYSNT